MNFSFSLFFFIAFIFLFCLIMYKKAILNATIQSWAETYVRLWILWRSIVINLDLIEDSW